MKLFISLRWAACIAFCAATAAGAVEPTLVPPLTFNENDRILVLAPHPDDETLGAGGVIQRALAAHAHVKIMFLTYGDNNAWAFSVFKRRPVFLPGAMRAMGEMRRQEAINAAKVLGVGSSDLIFLGYPDHGTLDIWLYNWNVAKPFRSQLTRTSGVPYKNAYDVDAPYAGGSIVTDIKHVLTAYRPTHVFVTSSADENPDHRAFYLFSRVALWELEPTFNPIVHPFVVHYRFRHWPVPPGYHPDQPLSPPSNLKTSINWAPFPLQSNEIALKYQALQQHATQFRYSGKYLSSFVRTNELFGEYPEVDVYGSEKIKLEKEQDESKSKEDLPPDYTDEEKEAFVDLSQRVIRIVDGRLVISTSYKRPFKNKFQFDLYAFGYRTDRSFAEMPKIRIIIRKNKAMFFDGRKLLPDTGIDIVREPNLLTVKVPLSLLGDPTRVLTGIHTSLEETPLDVMAWRALYLK